MLIGQYRSPTTKIWEKNMNLALPLTATPYRSIDSTVRDANGEALFVAPRDVADAIVAQCNAGVIEHFKLAA
jgi:hypothetical protein